MKPKRRVLFVREAGVGTLRMKSPIECFDKAFAIPEPFVKRTNEKRWIQSSKPLPPGVARRRQSPCCSGEGFSNFIHQALNERPELRVGCGPVSSAVSRDGLIEVARRNSKAIPFQHRVDFVIGLRKIKGLGQDSAQIAGFNREAISFQGTM